MIEIKKEIVRKLKIDKNPRDVIAGFDGFIDEIIHPVAKRLTQNKYQRIDTIHDFAQRIDAASGLSTNIELVTQLTKIGGNGVIMANALIQNGMNVDYFGSLGFPEINPLFKNFEHDCRSLVSLCEPGYTQALEFNDGKLLMGKITSLNEMNWQNIIEHTGSNKVYKLIADANLIAFTNWTMIFEMNGIINGIREILKKTGTKPLIFVDLADPAKRKNDDILEVLKLLSKLAQTARVILGMNEKESTQIASCLNIDEPDILTKAIKIRNRLDLFTVVIHPVKGAAAASQNYSAWVDGPYTPRPVLTTGAGDNFNAGFCLGMLLKMDIQQALYCGVYTSGFYVRQGKSPDRDDLINFLLS